MLRATFVFLFLGLGLPAGAGLVFDQTVLKEQADPAAETHEVKFAFHVEGDAPVTIENVSSSCHCISAGADKKVYQPGETGVVTAVFKLGTFEGETVKSLQVHSDDPDNRARSLQVKINIPKVFELSPEMTAWTVGDEPAPKTVTVKILGDTPIEVLGVTSSREAVGAELKEIAKGREYQVVVSPSSTEKPMIGLLKLTTNSEIPRFKAKNAYFNIQRVRASKAAAAPLVTPTAPAAAGTR